ncbi:metallopeptidase [Candidatus Pacearchaeota archaeon]|nr:metallopeptidase [Candidatus Pacearchaeota archaeon]|tara:strand:- start:2100 stop:2525 length:426 start_codon:yes stop_codon:yes gene_type:complete
MKYEDAPDLMKRAEEIVSVLGMGHVDLSRVSCIRSKGSKTRRTLARCHALGKLLQKAMGTKAFYAIEFLEPFEKLDEKEQDKVILHELMHIPKTFGGGFRHHDFVEDKRVDLMYERYESLKKGGVGEKNLSDSLLLGDSLR